MIHSRNLGCLKKRSCGNQREPQLSVRMGHLNMKPAQNPCQSLRAGSRFSVLNAAKVVKKSEVTEAAKATFALAAIFSFCLFDQIHHSIEPCLQPKWNNA
jgi:hypothetical protein